jgi:formate hydrogenlyase subunit 3/multisubunit Na+/H+ antiporter MnhD subunit
MKSSFVLSGADVALSLVACAAAAVMWSAHDHATFAIGLCVVLAAPLVEPIVHPQRRPGEGRGRATVLACLALAAAAAFGLAPQSAPVAIVAMGVLGAGFPLHVVYEAMRPHAGNRAFALLLLSQPGLAVAVQILSPQTVTLDVATRTAFTSWFVLSAMAQTGLALVRTDPMRALFGVGLSQSALLVAGALASEHGFTAEYLMLAGSDLGLMALTLVLGDLVRRHGALELRPDNGLAVIERRSAQLFLVAGWLFCGLPGGIVFFAEDLIFHALVQHSAWNTAGMVFVSVLNAIAFYRVYLGLYSGRMRPGAFTASELPAAIRVVVIALILATVFFGCWPQGMAPH